MRIALVQQHADLDLGAVARSHARRRFLRDRRPEIVPDLLGWHRREPR